MNPDDNPFQAAIARHVETYHDHFGPRLRAVYVWGSVHRGEAIRGVSDLDLHAFITDGRTSDDEVWFTRARAALDAEFPGLAGVSRPFSESVLLDGARPNADERTRTIAQSLGFRLRYDATRIWGREIVPDAVVPTPNAAFGRGPFEAVRNLARFAARVEPENKTDFDLPAEPGLRLRKVARLAVLGGGYLLMARGQFRSFRGADVLSVLHTLPQWADFLTETERWYLNPATDAAERIEAYQKRLVDWVEYVHVQLHAH